MRTNKALIVAAVLGAVVSLGGAAVGNASAPRFKHLDPGGQPRLTERVPVNVVFLGYEPSQVNGSAFRAALPRKYEPVVRSRLPYGIEEKLGLTYTYDYHVSFTDQAYENRFFGELKRLA